MANFDILKTFSATEQTRISKKLLTLRSQLEIQIPQKNIESSLMLATWNIREFDSGKYGIRTDESMLYLTEIISRFDLVAIQEVREDLAALIRLKYFLGEWWQYIFTDVTEGSKGNRERMAFLYDSRKIKFGGLAGEIVIPEKNDMKPVDQLSRTPFLVGFKAGWFNFMLCTVHIYYGTETANDPRRVDEIGLIARTLKDRATDNYTYANNLILLGDFNIFATDDITFKAITGAGFKIPDAIQKLPSNIPQNKHYDQIAFISPDIENQLDSIKAGVFNYYNFLYTAEEEKIYLDQMGSDYAKSSKGVSRTVKEKTQYYLDWRTYQMSDHLPMWVELQTDFSNEFLKNMAGEAPAGISKPVSDNKPPTKGKASPAKISASARKAQKGKRR